MTAVTHSSLRALPDLVPARMLNEYAYCPRLAYLEWVQGDFADSADTIEGRFHHRTTNTEAGSLPDAAALDKDKLHARSILLSSSQAGLIARIDLVEADGTLVTPVDYKRGKAPNIPEGAWEPERVQLCAQAIVLEENGYRVERGVLYFVGSRTRVTIAFDEALRARTLALLAEMRETASHPVAPPPLIDSPKCPRCSLVGICLPDETNLLRDVAERREAAEHDEPRRLIPARDDALPLYVHSAGTRIGRRGEELIIETREGEKSTARLVDISHVCLFGAVQLTTQAIQELCSRGIAVCYLSTGGWFYGVLRGMDHKHIDLRRRQFAAAANPAMCLALARRFATIKIKNQRTMVRRNADDPPAHAMSRLRELMDRASEADTIESLLGLEGGAARQYFEAFARMIRRESDGSPRLGFEFTGRNRRPPLDPVNALLSLGYALLTKDLTITLIAVGLDPYLGFFHQPRYGRPALALDLMEEFRPLIVDSIVLSAVNTGAVQSDDFIRRGGAVALTGSGRAKFIRAYERRMDELATHPVFGYRVSYRRILEIQARLLARFLSGEIAEYPPFATR